MRANQPFSGGLYDPSTEHDACGIGFVADIHGRRSRDIVEQALEILSRLAHRAACGCDPETGDGAGILVQLPHAFFVEALPKVGITVPRRRRYAVGQLFLPPDAEEREACETIVEQVIEQQGQRVLGWRDVPHDPSCVGRIARSVLPTMRQVILERRRIVPSAFERKLFVIKKLIERRVRESGADPKRFFHVASLSAETIVYKGLLLPDQLPRFYADLNERTFDSAIALVHSRFSTNTFPTWDLAQPFSHTCHNGEINTVRGNRNWMNARRSQLQSAKFGGPIERLAPIIDGTSSDSRQFDQMLELLYLGGRSLPQAIMMLIPEAWESNDLMDEDRRAFYDYTSSIMEPWDGPAAVAFTDGHLVGATLDRNGLRPARYLVTDDGRVILASETGVVDVEPHRVVRKGRLQPGRIFVVDTDEGRIIDDEEVKRDIVTRWPYARWLQRNVFQLERLPQHPALPALVKDDLWRTQRALGYSDEDVRLIIEPMAQDGKEPTGSMGTDTPLAVLSTQAPSLFNYFKQLFAQVTNPPIDPIRENLVMSLRTSIGMGGNTFDETPDQCHRLSIPGPVLTGDQLATIQHIDDGVFEAATLSLLYPIDEDPTALERAVDALRVAAIDAIDTGHNILVLSDRGVDARRAAIPALLAVSAVHQHLVREGIRMQSGLIVETGEAREVHHFALLVGYGAAAICPYLAFDTIREASAQGRIEVSADDAIQNYIKAVDAGLLKVMSKMGISTISSYRGAQIFEAIGIHKNLIDAHFSGTASRIGGIGMRELGRENRERHERAFGPAAMLDVNTLPAGGQYYWRRRGELHKWNPETISRLQAAVRLDAYRTYQEYARLADDELNDMSTLRGLLTLSVSDAPLIPLDEVESERDIAQRFCTGAMSFGSISAAAHEALAIAMNRLGGKSNSGEGGEEPDRFTPDGPTTNRRSAIKQIASGRFGVHAEYLVNADELQIKMAQGAKPGEGGQLPGFKVSERIARVRCSTPGVTLISPPPHHDIYSIEDLAQLIFDLKTVNPRARVSVKLVSEVGVGTVAAGVAKAGAHCIVVSGETGGTGASPLSSLKHAGVPWEMGIAETQQVLVNNDLRGRVRLQVDGGLRTGRDVVVAALLGGEEFGFSTAALVSLGCIMLRKCHLNTCSVGIATQREELVELFDGEPQHVERYMLFVAREVREIMARLGVRTFDELIGRSDLLTPRPVEHWKADKLDLSTLLVRPDVGAEVATRWDPTHVTPPGPHLDDDLLVRAEPSIRAQRPGVFDQDIRNVDRSVGAKLSGHIAARFGSQGLPDGSLTFRFRGSAGQSFGAFLARGVSFELEGDANDYVGKGLSGGRIAVFPPTTARFAAESNVIIGNTVLYGATSGEAFFRGLAGERFAVRNSGARAVVEGTGDHGCEYMTGGVVVVIGQTGRNFAAGMSGGMAFVFDQDSEFRRRCNTDMVELESMVDESDIWLVHGMLEDHVRFTRSAVASRLLDNWELMVPKFVKVMPSDFKRVLQARRAARRNRVTTEAAHLV